MPDQQAMDPPATLTRTSTAITANSVPAQGVKRVAQAAFDGMLSRSYCVREIWYCWISDIALVLFCRTASLLD